MKTRTIQAVAFAAMLLLSCNKAKPVNTYWAENLPKETVAAMSFNLTTVINNSDFQNLILKYPLANQIIELFIKKARINPSDETGKLSIALLSSQVFRNDKNYTNSLDNILLQFYNFKNHKELYSTLIESFPVEGEIAINGRNIPLYVILDIDTVHIRAMCIDENAIWIGDIKSLGKVSNQSTHDIRLLKHAVEGINPKSDMMGIVKPQILISEKSGKILQNMDINIPAGIEYLAWSITTPQGQPSSKELGLAICGTKNAVQEITPWVQRLFAAATALNSSNTALPQIIQETTRVSVQARLTNEQINNIFSKIGQPILMK